MVPAAREPAQEPVGAEVLAGRRPSRRRHTRRSGDRPARSSALRWAVALLLAAALAAAAVVALRPPVQSRAAEPTVTGLSLRIPVPRPAGSAARPITATYRVTAARSGSSLRVDGLTGPHLLGSSVRTESRPTARDSSLVTVSAVADCRSPSSLAAPSGRYVLVGRLTGLDGTTTRTRRRVPTSTVDWAAAVRQDCWQRVAARGVAVDDVTATPDPDGRGIGLVVRLTSSLSMAVRVGAVDVADVSTLEAAESGTLPAGGSLVLHVRLPIRDCRAGTLLDDSFGIAGRPAVLPWSVGPVGGDAAATFVLALPGATTGVVGEARHRFCDARAAGTT